MPPVSPPCKLWKYAEFFALIIKKELWGLPCAYLIFEADVVAAELAEVVLVMREAICGE